MGAWLFGVGRQDCPCLVGDFARAFVWTSET